MCPLVLFHGFLMKKKYASTPIITTTAIVIPAYIIVEDPESPHNFPLISRRPFRIFFEILRNEETVEYPPFMRKY
jgi:hypothetical protein